MALGLRVELSTRVWVPVVPQRLPFIGAVHGIWGQAGTLVATAWMPVLAVITIGIQRKPGPIRSLLFVTAPWTPQAFENCDEKELGGAGDTLVADEVQCREWARRRRTLFPNRHQRIWG